MPLMLMEGNETAKEDTLARIGDISDFQVFHTWVLVALYVRPDTTASGIILPDSVREEDRYQGKVGLVIKTGGDAFNDPAGNWTWGGSPPKLGDWVWFRASDGLALSINAKEGLCRVLKDSSIMGTLPRPDMIW